MNNNRSACLAGALLLCAISAGHAGAQSRTDTTPSAIRVAVAAPLPKADAALFDGTPCVGDDDFHRFDGSPVPVSSMPEALPVARVVIQNPESARERPRRAAERSRAAR